MGIRREQTCIVRDQQVEALTPRARKAISRASVKGPKRTKGRHMSKSRVFFLISVIGLILLFTISCGDGQSGQEGQEVDCATVDLANAPDSPVSIRLGHGFAAEEQVWLMQARPDLTQYQGEWYELEYTPFRATEERYSAYQAGDLDALTVSAPALIRAVAQGIPSKAVVTVTRETEEQHTTRGVALDDSGITGPEDLRGKTIGIVDIGTATDYWAKSAVASAGYDFRTDAEYVVLPFPAQEEALRSGQIDVASLPEPFYTIANLNGG